VQLGQTGCGNSGVSWLVTEALLHTSLLLMTPGVFPVDDRELSMICLLLLERNFRYITLTDCRGLVYTETTHFGYYICKSELPP